MMIKRIIDVLISLNLIILLSPVVIILIFVLQIKIGRPVFFFQNRPGFNGKKFKMIKFRTMLSMLDHEGQLLPDEIRLTQFGRWLRSTSLDELPSLWNVLKGDMSLVGPRPLLMEYLSLYNEEQARRHLVKPGITGWAQVNGRNAITWEEKFNLDIWYIDNQSIWLDLKILFLTLKKVIIKEGISEMGQATMSKFEGNKN